MWCCKNNAQNNNEADYGNIASISETEIFNDTVLSVLDVKQEIYKESPKFIYYFNGDCASCIAAFLTFFENWQQTEMIMPTFFIASASSLDVLNFYMEKANLKLHNSLQFLLLDNQELVKKYNPYMNHVKRTIYILLIDRENRIIESRNPFLVKNSMLKYDRINDDYKLHYNPRAIQQQPGTQPLRLLDFIDESNPPLIMLNGEESSSGAVKRILGEVKEWSYVKGASAVLLYGNKGKNGVLVVRTR